MTLQAISAARVVTMFRDADRKGPWPSEDDCIHMAAALTRTAEAPPNGRIPNLPSRALKAGQIFRKRLLPVVDVFQRAGAVDEATELREFESRLGEVLELIGPAPRPRLAWHVTALKIATSAGMLWARAGKTGMGLTNDGPLVTFVTSALIEIGCLSSGPDADHGAAVGRVLRAFWKKNEKDPVRRALRRLIDRAADTDSSAPNPVLEPPPFEWSFRPVTQPNSRQRVSTEATCIPENTPSSKKHRGRRRARR